MLLQCKSCTNMLVYKHTHTTRHIARQVCTWLQSRSTQDCHRCNQDWRLCQQHTWHNWMSTPQAHHFHVFTRSEDIQKFLQVDDHTFMLPLALFVPRGHMQSKSLATARIDGCRSRNSRRSRNTCIFVSDLGIWCITGWSTIYMEHSEADGNTSEWTPTGSFYAPVFGTQKTAVGTHIAQNYLLDTISHPQDSFTQCGALHIEHTAHKNHQASFPVLAFSSRTIVTQPQHKHSLCSMPFSLLDYNSSMPHEGHTSW